MSKKTLQEEFIFFSKEIEEIAKHHSFNGWMIFKNPATIRSQNGFIYNCLYEIKGKTLCFYLPKKLKKEKFHFSLGSEDIAQYQEIEVHYVDY